MTNDDKALVERLRQLANNTGKMTWVNDIPMTATAALHLSADRIEALSAEVERRTIDGIHTCHDECQRVACVLRRENERLREAVIEECANALEADAKKCDCAAREANECACGAWDDYKSITSARAVEIVRALQETGR